MPLTEQQLKQIYPLAGQRVAAFLPVLNTAMANWEIDHPKRVAAFLAQVGHESGQLRYVKELGNDKYLARYDTGTLALRLGNTPEADGDGQRYCGRGLIQVTGVTTTRPAAVHCSVTSACWRNRRCSNSRVGRANRRPGSGTRVGSTPWPTRASSTASPGISTVA